MKKTLLLMGIVAAIFSSCSRDEVQEVNRGNAIEFRTATTRATEINSTNDLPAINVTAYNDAGGVYFEDVTFTKSTYDVYNSPGEAYYWPNDGSNLYFFSYGPGENNPAVFYPESKTLSYTPNEAVSAQIDLLAAVGSGNNENQTVELNFKHILSQINISAKIDASSPYLYNIRGVRIGNVVSSGTYAFENTEDEEESGVEPTAESAESPWTGGNDLTSYTIKFNTPITLNGTPQNLMGDEGCAMVIPQNGNAWNPEAAENTGRYIAVLANIKIKNGEENGEATYAPFFPTEDENSYAWIAIPIDTDWVMNTRYNYTIDFTNGAGYVAPPDEDDDDDDDEGDDDEGDDDDDDYIVKPGGTGSIIKPGEEIIKGTEVFFTTTMGDWATPEENKTASDLIGIWTVREIKRYNDIPYPDDYPDNYPNQTLEDIEPDLTEVIPSTYSTDEGIKGYMSNGQAFREFQVFTTTSLGPVGATFGTIGFHIEELNGRKYVYIDTYLDQNGAFEDRAGRKYNKISTIDELNGTEAIIRTIFDDGTAYETYDIEYLYYDKSTSNSN